MEQRFQSLRETVHCENLCVEDLTRFAAIRRDPFLTYRNPARMRGGESNLYPLTCLCIRNDRSSMRSFLDMVKILVDIDSSPDIVGEAIFEIVKRQRQCVPIGGMDRQTTVSTDDILKLLLTACPAAAGYQVPEGGMFLFHFCCRYIVDEELWMAVFRIFLQARKECISDKDESDGWMAVHHAALKRSLRVMCYLIDCCPASATCCSSRGSSLLHIALRSYSQNEVEAKVAYLCSDPRFRHLLRARDSVGLTPLHTALHREGATLSIIQAICEAAPGAVNDFVERDDTSSSWHRALPLHLAIGHMSLTSPASKEADIFRYLLANAPASADQKDGRGSTPYSLSLRSSRRTAPVHPYFKRLLLRACPHMDRDELCRMTYEPRRMALWLGLTAVSSDKTFSLWSRRRFPEDVFRHIVLFL